MHPNNIHKGEYDFKSLVSANKDLTPLLVQNPKGALSIDFSNPKAVYALNKALLNDAYGITYWKVPEGALCPPIPSRADYIHHLKDLVPRNKEISGLDIGTGANAIYPLLGQAIYKWKMVGCDSNKNSVTIAQENTGPYDLVTIRYQDINSNLFKGIVKENEYFDFTMCNPPFYTSAEEAFKTTITKQNKLGLATKTRNFGGHANELWCNGGEALFIKRLIKESVLFKDQVGWFTCLLSQKKNVPKVIKQLTKLNAIHRIVPMEQGNKKSRFVAWSFNQNKGE